MGYFWVVVFCRHVLTLLPANRMVIYN
jgi:hypothetical protein